MEKRPEEIVPNYGQYSDHHGFWSYLDSHFNGSLRARSVRDPPLYGPRTKIYCMLRFSLFFVYVDSLAANIVTPSHNFIRRKRSQFSLNLSVVRYKTHQLGEP